MVIGVLDYGSGNLKNVCRAIEYLGFQHTVVTTPADVLKVHKLMIPGVGAFKVAMEQLNKMKLIEPIKEVANKGTPVLGICLGMQLLFEKSSEFGITEGLGLLSGSVNLIPSFGLYGHRLKVPHIGWSALILDDRDSEIVKNVQPDDTAYFVHSYIAEDYSAEDLVAHCIYDGLILPAVVRKNNIIGCQFHPEKSGELGLEIFKNFLRMN